MVQLQNSDRLNQKIEFGTVTDDEDQNGTPTNKFDQIGKPTLCGNWGLTTSQTIQRDGLNRSNSFIIVVHHRNSWDGITHAQLNGQLYEVSGINADPFRNPTAYDQITLTKAGEESG